MTRSIFDPGGGETERSGSTHLGPEAANASRMPPSVVDGEAGADQEATLEAIDRADDTPAPMAADADAKGLSPEERIAAIPNTGSAGETES